MNLFQDIAILGSTPVTTDGVSQMACNAMAITHAEIIQIVHYQVRHELIRVYEYPSMFSRNFIKGHNFRDYLFFFFFCFFFCFFFQDNLPS